jgi:hypothetical protein
MQDEIQVTEAENEKKMIAAAYFQLRLLEINAKKPGCLGRALLAFLCYLISITTV